MKSEWINISGHECNSDHVYWLVLILDELGLNIFWSFLKRFLLLCQIWIRERYTCNWKEITLKMKWLVLNPDDNHDNLQSKQRNDRVKINNGRKMN